jgi:hypothetical protein
MAPLRSGTARVAERLAYGPALAHAKVRVSHDGRIAPTEELLASGDPLPGAVPRAWPGTVRKCSLGNREYRV